MKHVKRYVSQGRLSESNTGWLKRLACEEDGCVALGIYLFDGLGKNPLYKLPKDKLIYGPMQLESRIDQQTEISSQLTLWGQRGSEVIRGNLLAIPIESSFLYVEPIYLQARREPDQQMMPAGKRANSANSARPPGGRMSGARRFRS